MEDKEQILSRVVGFLYDALDNFKSTMDDVSTSLNTLMSSLTKVERDLQTLGVKPKHAAPLSAGQIASRIKAGSSSSSRERLIGLLTGQPISSSASASTPFAASKGTSTPAPAIKVSAKPKPPLPMSGPPKAMSGPPKVGPPRTGPPTAMKIPAKPIPSIKTPSAPVMKPPTVPSIKPPPTASSRPPIMKTPTPPMAKPTAAAPTGQKPGGSIIGLRDEMLKELKRLKSIMKGG